MNTANISITQGVFVTIVIVNVTLKSEILDPQGRAVLGALGRVGLPGVVDVRQASGPENLVLFT
jgi:hypothetical protein